METLDTIGSHRHTSTRSAFIDHRYSLSLSIFIVTIDTHRYHWYSSIFIDTIDVDRHHRCHRYSSMQKAHRYSSIHRCLSMFADLHCMFMDIKWDVIDTIDIHGRHPYHRYEHIRRYPSMLIDIDPRSSILIDIHLYPSIFIDIIGIH